MIVRQLTIEPIGDEIEVAEGQTILDACLRAGVYLPHACGHGLCGTCKTQVLDGEIDHGEASPFALMDFERDEGFVLACTATLKSDVAIEADVEDDPDARRIPVRDFVGEVVALDDLTHDVKGVRLALRDGPIDFQAGQYVNVFLPGIEASRAFSIANPPSDSGHVELQIRRVPGGEATGYVHERLQLGDKLKITGPQGRFIVRKSRGGPLLFLAGGTGVSSPRSMILDLLEEGYAEPITLVHGVRAQADLYGRDEFEALARSHDNFHYAPALSHEPEPSEWRGDRGFVHDVAKRIFGGVFEGSTAYLCGPPPMIEACIATLMQGRLFEKHIFTERFFTAKDCAEKPKSPVFKRL
ncbi:2Fe-2S iron-sulfur cluster binding domain-containing protein [Rhodoblastus acidophilus]|uniref:2Fe-2S iron-sulfur cluster binding domain-containing protein n=2 Tax=Candidatus Rhodoblastus alkanivorans TaxID=2954117 RepID=A0ABS9Z6W5_9HYPH|nr:2Fe-2S iron-sulfur cluster binding domain-containing protein [Candidatus Rhodoblastus alkanivorans]MCI4682372.1 2Fe-2S iron-sulfur cluster binding domain-containing protein [Candidatus Rhodoblastus alkanivorans]MDI4639675.1 2Fe-2S iron-sulfur cluster binding domain-containing protein [Rhodoblastus acidophilus]